MILDFCNTFLLCFLLSVCLLLCTNIPRLIFFIDLGNSKNKTNFKNMNWSNKNAYT